MCACVRAFVCVACDVCCWAGGSVHFLMDEKILKFWVNSFVLGQGNNEFKWYHDNFNFFVTVYLMKWVLTIKLFAVLNSENTATRQKLTAVEIVNFVAVWLMGSSSVMTTTLTPIKPRYSRLHSYSKVVVFNPQQSCKPQICISRRSSWNGRSTVRASYSQEPEKKPGTDASTSTDSASIQIYSQIERWA